MSSQHESRVSAGLIVLIVVLMAAGTIVIISIWERGQSAASVWLAPTAVVTVDTNHRGDLFERGAVGLSLEVHELNTDRLSASHYRLVRLMRLLGPSVLRIGGSGVDFSWWTSSGESAPSWATSTVTPADLSTLYHLMVVTGWRVLLGVNLGHFDPARAADEALYAHEILGTRLLGVEIGNEPDNYAGATAGLRASTYDVNEYLREAVAYREALNAAAPGVAVYGPALSRTQWLTVMGATASMYTELTQHYYPGSVCPGEPPLSAEALQATATGLLSAAVREEENHTLDVLGQARGIAGRPTRIGETNSVSCGGSRSASPVFASALWSLDWALRAADSGVSGLNFHGQLGFCGIHSYSPICAPSYRAAEAGEVVAQPEYYGLLAARQLEGGRFAATMLKAPGQLPNLTTWATVAPNGTVRLAIDDLAIAGPNQLVSVAAAGYTPDTEETLSAASPTARSGVRLATASVTDPGVWKPVPRDLRRIGHSPTIIVRPASAVIITLRPK